MRRNTPFEPAACPLELIEPFLDDELDESSYAEVEAHLADCPSCREELQLARAVRVSLRDLPMVDCPPSVVDAVFAAAQSPPVTPPGSNVLALPTATSWRRPALWLAAAAVLLALFATPRLLDREPTELADLPVADGHSPAEVAQAEKDVRLALSIFAQLSDRVGDIVQEEVIGRRVSTAPSAALEAIGGRKEEAQ